MNRIEAARHAYAEELRFVARVRDEAVVRAFATVPRERFLGPGPWLIPHFGGGAAWRTPDDDPVHLYHNVLIAIDPERNLNNGHPEFWATLLDAVGIRAGDTVLHVGAGTGYYTAIQAELAGPSGRVIAFEIDPELARRAAANLADRATVALIHGNGAERLATATDDVIVNAGVTHLDRVWLDALNPGGRVLVPLTTDRRDGIVLRIERLGDSAAYAARVASPVRIYPCSGARDAAAETALVGALAGGGQRFIRSVRRDAHAPAPTCWLHRDGCCISTERAADIPSARVAAPAANRHRRASPPSPPAPRGLPERPA